MPRSYGPPPERRTGAVLAPVRTPVSEGCVASRCGARGRRHPAPSPRPGPARRRACPSPRPCAPRDGPRPAATRRRVTSPAAFFVRPVILSMMLMRLAYPAHARPETPYSFRAVTNEEAHRLAREKGVSRLAVRARARDRGAPVPALVPHARVGRRAHPGGGRGDRRPQPQELLGLVLHRRLHAPPRALHGQDGADRGALRAAAGAARRLPGAPRPGRRGRARDRAHHPRAGRPAGAVPRGHPHPRPRRRSATRERGAGRLALETGAPLVPCAITRHREALPRPASRCRAGCRWRSPSRSRWPSWPSTPEAAGDARSRSMLWPEVEERVPPPAGAADA